MIGLRERLNRLAAKILDYAVAGDAGAWSVRFARRLLRLHPSLYLAYCYRAGWLREVLRVSARRPVRGVMLERAVRRSAQMCAVLDGERTLVETPDSGMRRPFNQRVLLAFHSAASFDPAGYTVRSGALMRALDEAGVAVTACTRLGYPWDLAAHRDKPRCAFSMAEGFRIHHFEDPDELIGDEDSRYVAAYADRLSALSEAENASVIHAASNFLNGLAAAEAGRRLGVGSVYEMRGLWHLSRAVMEPAFRETEHFAYCEAMEVAAAGACDRVVVISEALRRWLMARGVPGAGIHVIPNAAESADLPDSAAVPAEKREEPDAVTVGFIGSLTAYEGLDLLIHAVARLAPRFPALRCLIVGDGREREALQRLARRLGCAERVRFTGRVPRAEVAAYYRAIDIFPLPRRRYEVCELVPPLKPLEIMAHERTLIVSDVAPLAEMVRHEHTGLVCPADDVDGLAAAIARLTEDGSLRRRLAAGGRRLVEAERRWTHNARLYTRLYAGIAAGAGERTEQRC